jgi:PAS domain-containing protein
MCTTQPTNGTDEVELTDWWFGWAVAMWGGGRKPTLVSYFAGPLQARHMFVNPQLCRLVGHSQEDLLFSKPRTFMILVPDKTWQLHRLLFGTG